MKRRLLIVESDSATQAWLTDQLKDRFRSITSTVVSTLDAANHAIIDYGCDLIIADMQLAGTDSPAAVLHSLMAFAPGIPIIAITDLQSEDESLLDVLTVGVRHILFKDDLKTDCSKLVTAVVDTVRELANRDISRDSFGERMQALSQKVWDVDNRMRSTEALLVKLTASIDKLADTIDKRGGLEDRVKELEKAHTLAVRVCIGVVGMIGTVLAAVVTAVISYLQK